MATFNDLPTFGDGILIPQLQHQWRLRFIGNNIPFTDTERQLISMQIISCGIDYHLKTLSMVLEQNRYTSDLHDIVKKLSTLAKSDVASNRISFIVDFLDGNNETHQSFKFEGCALIAHEFDLNYAVSDTAKHKIKFSYKTTKEV